MKVPTITADDLAAYHAHVYGHPAPSRSLPSYSNPPYQIKKRKRSEDNSPDDHATWGNDVCQQGPEKEGSHWGMTNEEVVEYDEDDHLGYYSDGVKRTLTDEQIAMFRHSELYARQRRQEVARENREAEEGEEEEQEEEGEIDEHADIIDLQVGESCPSKNGILDTAIPPPMPQPPKPSLHIDQPQQTTGSRNQRRKKNKLRSDLGLANDINQERHSRAQIRELDAAASAQENQTLDYGDGELNYGEDACPTSVSNPTEAPGAPITREGKKIWWPILAE